MARFTTPLLAAVACALLLRAGGDAPRAVAGGTVEARNPADVYERNKSSLKDVVLHVVGDLKLRAEAWAAKAGIASGGAAAAAPSAGGATAGTSVGATLVLVVDPTPSMREALGELREAVIDAMAEGPRGLKIGVLGASAEWTPPGHPGEARGALAALQAVPLSGPKNLLEAVREAASALKAPADEPRAILLVTLEGGDGEDDVEATRELLAERGVAFYSVAREAAFERPWKYDFLAVTASDLGLSERWNPTPRRGQKGELFYGADVAWGLVPYRWELPQAPLAQTEFAWGGGGQFPVPSGFGYWALASLSHSSGGRCFVYNFRAPGARSKDQDRYVQLYDLGYLNLFAPDLRPRAEVARALSQDRKAVAIVRIWEHLAEDEAPLVCDHGTLERAGQSLVARPMLPVRSSTPFETSYREMGDVVKARAVALERQRRAEQALSWWAEAAKHETTTAEGPVDPLRRRVEADFDLLGAQLQKVRFHWGEIRAALETIKPDMVDGEHVTALVPVALALGAREIRVGGALPDASREAAFLDLLASLKRMAEKYRMTPWGLIVEKGAVVTFITRTVDLRPPKPDPNAPKPEPPRKGPMPPPPPRPAPAPPPPPERPSSGSGSSTTNK